MNHAACIEFESVVGAIVQVRFGKNAQNWNSSTIRGYELIHDM